MEIKQLGVCKLLVEYKTYRKICEFYVVDFPTAILGIHDSGSLRLITIHFDSVGTEMSQPEPDSEPELSFKTKQSSLIYENAIQNDANSDEFR